MPSQPVPDDVARLLSSSIDSAAEIEVLLFLHRRPAGDWDPRYVADFLYLDRGLTQEIFKKLCARGFLTAQDEPYLVYRYAPAADVVSTIETLAALYADRRLMIVAMVAARRPNGLQLFSSAFRLRKDSR